MPRHDRVDIAFTGDMCPMGEVARALRQGGGEVMSPELSDIFAGADLVVGNLETPLTRRGEAIPKTGPNFRADPDVAEHLAQLGFDVLTLANNHIADYGEAGIEDTTAALESADVHHCGAGLTQSEAASPLYVSAREKRVALISVADGEFAEPVADGPGAARLDLHAVAQRIQKARREADVVVACVHAGSEYHLLPAPGYRRLYRRLADAGPDAVICHHPHVALTYEIHDGVPIFYSLGNFLLEPRQGRPPAWYLAEVPVLSVGSDGVDISVELFRTGKQVRLERRSERQQSSFRDYAEKARNILREPDVHRAVWEQQVRNLFRDKWPRWRSRLGSLVLPGEGTSQRIVGQVERLVEGPNVKSSAEALLHNICGCRAHRWTVGTASRLMLEDRFEKDDGAAQKKLAALQDILLEAAGVGGE